MTTTYTPDPEGVTFKHSLNIPDDNNKPTADVLGTLFRTLLANDAYMQARGIQDIQIGTSSFSNTLAGSGAYADVSTAGGFVPRVDVANCLAGDVVLCFATGQYDVTPPSGNGAFSAAVRLAAVQDFGGSAIEAAAPGATSSISTLIVGGSYVSSGATLLGRVAITTPGTCRVKLQGNASVGRTIGVASFTLIAVRVRLYT